jgi:hypothetical protein
MVLLEGLDMALRQNQWPFDNQSLAQAYLDWPTDGPVRKQSELNALRQEWLAEWHLASRWCLGERDLTRALPPERIWNGLPTCCGQMTMLPLAGLFPGDPDARLPRGVCARTVRQRLGQRPERSRRRRPRPGA